MKRTRTPEDFPPCPLCRKHHWPSDECEARKNLRKGLYGDDEKDSLTKKINETKDSEAS